MEQKVSILCAGEFVNNAMFLHRLRSLLSAKMTSLFASFHYCRILSTLCIYMLLPRYTLTHTYSISPLMKERKMPADDGDRCMQMMAINPCGRGVIIQPTPALWCVVGGDYLRDKSYPLPPAHCRRSLLACNAAYELG